MGTDMHSRVFDYTTLSKYYNFLVGSFVVFLLLLFLFNVKCFLLADPVVSSWGHFAPWGTVGRV